MRPAFQPNVCIVRLMTGDGLVALGESYYSAEAVETYIHRSLAPLLLMHDDLSPELFALLASPYVGYQGGGVEVRAMGAVDIALWDLLGQRTGQPVARLLGGPVRDSVRVYNTCAGPGYVNTTSRQHSSNWGLGSSGSLEDLDAFLTRPGELAAELRDEGFTGMKIWPFDRYAEASRGNEISATDLAEGIAILEQVRSVVSPHEMDVMVELHGLWNRNSATSIAHALADLEPYWIEDPIRADSLDALQRFRDDVSLPIAIGETAVGMRGFLPLLQAGIPSFVTVDAQWTGGLTSARRVASLADAFSTAVAPHDCTGPITFAAVCHLTMSQPNAVVQESVRAFLRTWYPDIVDGLPEIHDGYLSIHDSPGLGLRLSERLVAPDVVRHITRPSDL